jgi:hypothetical protein
MENDSIIDKEENTKKSIFFQILNKIKEYLSLIIFLPTLLGGLWQVIVLSQFGLSYIRFFSISQLLSDGLILLFFLPLIALIIFIVYHIYLGLKIDLKKNRKTYAIATRIILGLIYLYVILWAYLGRWTFDYQIYVEFFIGALSLFCLLIFFDLGLRFSKAFSYLVERLRRLKLNKSDYQAKYGNLKSGKINLAYIPYPYFILFCFPVFIGYTVKTILVIGQYYIPENLYNTETVIFNVEKKYKIDSDDFEIKYFSDKYIFIEHYLLTKEKRDSIKILNDTLEHSKKVTFPSKILVLKSDVFFDF